MVPLDAVVQDGDHHVPAGVAPLPRGHDVHPRATAAVSVAAVTGTALTDSGTVTAQMVFSVSFQSIHTTPFSYNLVFHYKPYCLNCVFEDRTAV